MTKANQVTNGPEDLTRALEQSPEEWPALIAEFVTEAGLTVRRESDGDVVLVRADGRKARAGYTGKQFRLEVTDRDKPTFVPGAGIRGNAGKLVEHLVQFME